MDTGPTPTFTVSDPNEPVIDTETTRTRRPNRPLLATSSLLFVSSYVATVITEGVKDRNRNLYIPFAGPWMDLAQGHHSTAEKTLLSLSGVLQGLGGLGIVSSFFVPEKRTRDWYLIGGRATRAFNISPRLGRGTYALTAGGSF